MSWPTNNWSPNYNGKRSIGPLSMNVKMKPNVAAQVTPQIQDNNAIFAAADKAQAADPTAALDPKIASAQSALRAMGLMIPPGKGPAVPPGGAAKHAVDAQKVLFETSGLNASRGGADSPHSASQENTPANGEPVKAAGALSFLKPLARKIPKEWLSGDRSVADIASDVYRNWFAGASLPGGSHLKTPGNYYLRTPQILRDLDMSAMRQQFNRPGARIDGNLFGPSHARSFDFAKQGTDKQAGLGGIVRALGKAVTAVPKGVAKVPGYIKDTFKPGVAKLRQQMRAPVGGPERRFGPAGSTNTGGRYLPYPHRATANAAKGTQEANRTMRHELSHATTTPQTGTSLMPVVSGSGLRGTARRWQQAPEGSWREGLGRVLSETIANAAERKSTPGQVARGMLHLLDPAKAMMYARQYGLKGALFHGATSLPSAAGATYGVSRGVDEALDLFREEDEKRAVLEPLWGGLGGAYVAPKTKRLEGAVRGAGVGLTSMLGGLGTGTLGYQLAKGRNLGTTSIAGYDIPNEVLVGLASSLPGNALGYLAGKEMFWPKRWEDPQDRVKEDMASLIGLQQGG